MTSLQRQAVLVCVVCALAALLTVGITLTLLKRGKPETPGTPADSVPTDTTGDGAEHKSCLLQAAQHLCRTGVGRTLMAALFRPHFHSLRNHAIPSNQHYQILLFLSRLSLKIIRCKFGAFFYPFAAVYVIIKCMDF